MSLLTSRVPLAWLNLVHETRRLLLSVVGTGFAVLLLFMQLGFRGALFDSTLQLPRVLNADLILVSPTRITLSGQGWIPLQRLVTARGVPGVASASPFYMMYVRPSWRNALTGETSPVAVFAFDPRDPAMNLPELRELADELAQPRRVMFDRKSKPHYGSPERGDESMLSEKRVEVVGTYSLGTDFVSDGDLITSDLTYRDLLFPPMARNTALSSVDLGLVKLQPGSDLPSVRKELAARMESDTIVLTKEEFVAREHQFWQDATPIGYIFGFGVALGLFVGMIICYQILYADVADHLAEYATLKAMGYSVMFFVQVMLSEALIVAVLGFVPGALASLGLYYYVSHATGLPMIFTLSRSVWVLMMTIAMCFVSGLLAIRGMFAADPAELFK